MLVKVDREKARLYELSTQEIAAAFRNSVYGYEASKFKDGEDEYDIFIRLAEKYRNDVSTLMNQKIQVKETAFRFLQWPILNIQLLTIKLAGLIING